MTLEEALNQIDQLADEDVLFAKRPWRLDADALIGRLDEDFGVPGSISILNFEYFIDVPVAKEVLGVFARGCPQSSNATNCFSTMQSTMPIRVGFIKPSSRRTQPFFGRENEPHVAHGILGFQVTGFQKCH